MLKFVDDVVLDCSCGDLLCRSPGELVTLAKNLADRVAKG